MPLSLEEKQQLAVDLNRQLKHHSAVDVLRKALQTPQVGKIAMVSSFGAESVALLHVLCVADPAVPVLFIDTHMLFAETLAYQMELSDRLGLKNVQIVHASDASLQGEDPDGTLHKNDPNACCALRKTRPLQKALRGYDAWITGRKRFQSGTRAALEFFEVDPLYGKIKVNPLAAWAPEDVQDYITENRLPKHPLIAKGYPSIGCMPCTSPVKPGDDPRAGRWRGQAKTECGIHSNPLPTLSQSLITDKIL